MERVHKKDLALYSNKDYNVATIKGAFGRLLMHAVMFAAGSFAVLLIAINDICKQYTDKGVYDNPTFLVYAIILFAVAATVIIIRAIMLKAPNIYFVGNEMYIKENKDYYLNISPQEIDEYGWLPLSSQNYAGVNRTSRGHSTCSYCGYLNLVVNGNKYRLSCSSMKKAKHYIEGFMNGISVQENNFDGDSYRALYLRIYSATSIVTCMMVAFCFLMFSAVNNAVAVISVILFAGSILTGIILFIRLIVKYKNVRQMEGECFDNFVIKQPVKFKVSEENENIPDDDLNDSDNN